MWWCLSHNIIIDRKVFNIGRETRHMRAVEMGNFYELLWISDKGVKEAKCILSGPNVARDNLLPSAIFNDPEGVRRFLILHYKFESEHIWLCTRNSWDHGLAKMVWQELGKGRVFWEVKSPSKEWRAEETVSNASLCLHLKHSPCPQMVGRHYQLGTWPTP